MTEPRRETSSNNDGLVWVLLAFSLLLQFLPWIYLYAAEPKISSRIIEILLCQIFHPQGRPSKVGSFSLHAIPPTPTLIKIKLADDVLLCLLLAY